MTILSIILGVAVVILLWAVGAYNLLVRLRTDVKNAWSQIDVQLKRRHELIPNLVETVKGYLTHERETLEKVIQARNQAVGAAGIQEKAQAENMITQSLRSLFALSERYPDLKANQNMLSLQGELASTEDRIGNARQLYNDQVTRLNTAIDSVPTNFIAGMSGFAKESFFELQDPGERQAPRVRF